MTHAPFYLMLAASAALAGCNRQDHSNVAGPGDGSETNATGQVQLPPSISASKIYRCAGNGLVYVDWLSDGKSANLRTDKAGPPTQVIAAEGAAAMTAAGGYSLSGTPDAATVKIAIPGQAEKSCKA